jgi:uncharacterized protein
MKLQPDKSDTQFINAYRFNAESTWIEIGFVDKGTPKLDRVSTSVVIGSRGERLDWAGITLATLTAEHFDQVAAFKPELVVFGSGAKLQFPSPALQRSLMQARIGLETMDTLAACRTYNILAGEGRHVVAVLLF